MKDYDHDRGRWNTKGSGAVGLMTWNEDAHAREIQAAKKMSLIEVALQNAEQVDG